MYDPHDYDGITDESEARENARLDEEYEEAQMLICEARDREEAIEEEEADRVTEFVDDGWLRAVSIPRNYAEIAPGIVVRTGRPSPWLGFDKNGKRRAA